MAAFYSAAHPETQPELSSGYSSFATGCCILTATCSFRVPRAMEIRLADKEKIQQIASPDDIYGIMQRILLRENKIDREKEHFWIIGMDMADYILCIELVSLDSVKSTVVEPMNVYRFAVMKNAVRVFAVHNHPGGNLTPSPHDRDTTDRLIQVGRILGIVMEDHLII
ncbi:MAG: JAB domain-containing protein [Herbaspirillum sp.]